MWHKSTGKIVYDPYRGALKKKPHWWCVVEVDKEITRYYRWWIERRHHIKELKQPSWDAHISIIRGEKPRRNQMHLWKKYHGEIVEFEYMHNPRRSGDTTGGDRPDNYWFVEVRAPELIDIRKEFGYPCDWKLHLTVGRTWY
jgi:hypothetical protein